MGTHWLTTLFVGFLLILLTSTDSHAQKKFAVGINGGSNGIGAEGTIRIHERINARVGFHTFAYNQTGSYNDLEVGIDYDGDLDMSNYSLLVDFLPFKKFLRVTAGFYKMDWALDGVAIPNESYDFEDRTFDPDRLGTLTTNLVYPDGFSPYFGLGFGNQVGGGLPLKFTMDLGMIRTGAPEISMSGTGLIAPTADNANSLQEGFNEFEWYPVVRLGLSFSFINANNSRRIRL